jgi:replicative DNA helicase
MLRGGFLRLLHPKTLSLDSVLLETYRAASATNAGLIIVDSLPLLCGTEFFGLKHRLGAQKVLRTLRSLAEHLNAVVVVQLGMARAIDSRADKRPRSIDECRGGPSLSTLSDGAILLYRDIYTPPQLLTTKERSALEVYCANKEDRFRFHEPIRLHLDPETHRISSSGPGNANHR